MNILDWFLNDKQNPIGKTQLCLPLNPGTWDEVSLTSGLCLIAKESNIVYCSKEKQMAGFELMTSQSQEHKVQVPYGKKEKSEKDDNKTKDAKNGQR